MQTGMDLVQYLILDPLKAAFVQLMQFAPAILGALLILVIGWIIAKTIEGLIVKGLKLLVVDKIAEEVRIGEVLRKGGIRRKLSELIGAIIYWIVILAFVMTALNALNLTVAAELFQMVIAFLPNVIAAVFILVVGIFASVFLSATVRTAASNAGVPQAHLLGELTQAVVVIFTVVASLQQLRIQFIGEVFLIVLAGISLGAALAFGLGCKELAGKWVAGFIEQFKPSKR